MGKSLCERTRQDFTKYCANHSYLQPRGLNCEGHSSDGIGRMHMEGASGCRQTAMHDPGAQYPGHADVFDWESILEREENRRKSQVEID